MTKLSLVCIVALFCLWDDTRGLVVVNVSYVKNATQIGYKDQRRHIPTKDDGRLRPGNWLTTLLLLMPPSPRDTTSWGGWHQQQQPRGHVGTYGRAFRRGEGAQKYYLRKVVKGPTGPTPPTHLRTLPMAPRGPPGPPLVPAVRCLHPFDAAAAQAAPS